MRKKLITGHFISLILAVSLLAVISGCSKTADKPRVNETPLSDVVAETAETAQDEKMQQDPQGAAKTTEAAPDENISQDPQGADDPSRGEADIPDIIWLGDSLTQGSLGDDNFNENNPQAPWRVLAEISGCRVSGYGYYGYRTHDILWKFGEEGGIKDPGIVYIFWVGSNDFHDSPDEVKYVIEETDRFNGNAGITRYLMLGTTNRGDMAPDAHIGINSQLKEHYGEKYLDIMPYVEYGPDNIHLTESSYRKIAEAVYDKLLSAGYIKK